MKSHIRFGVSSMAVLIAAMLIAVPSIRADSLTILNHSFENGVMDAANRYGTTSDWEVGGYNISNAGVWIDDNLDADIYRPTTAEYTNPGVVPEGEKVAWVLGIADYDNGIRQILTSNLAPNLTYTLKVAIGNPALYNVPPPAPNYRIELLAGGVLLASSTGSPPANDSAFKTATLTYSSGPSPAQAGQPLEIRLITVVDPRADFYEVDFDDVRLTTIPGNDPISVVGTSFLNDAVDRTSYTLSFNAGASANKLIVSAGSENGAAITGITYGGVAMTLIPNTGGGTDRNRGIWYLDNPFSTGTANIVVSGNGVTSFTQMRLGVASISGSAPGCAIGNIAAAASVSLNVPVSGSFVFAAYAGNLSTTTTANAPLTRIFGVTGDSANMAAGYQNSVVAGPATYSFTNTSSPLSSAAAFVPANTFSSWISNPAFGLAVADQDFADDPDGDGIDNGVENFFGTNPGTFTQGLLVGAKSGNTFTFTHPQNATPGSDLTANYRWSKDFATFLANGATDGAGTTVDFTTQADTPSPGITKVTATVTGTATSKLFVRVNVTQP